jgi:hypothetical protein
MGHPEEEREFNMLLGLALLGVMLAVGRLGLQAFGVTCLPRFFGELLKILF